MKAVVSTCVLAALVCGFTEPAAANTYDRRTHFTFNQPITLPGVTLPAGTYTFRVADPTAKVVQVLNGNGTESYAMLMSIPAYRQDIAEKPEISFMETAADKPAAVKTWWQQGTRLGYEFIYPREQTASLTRAAAPAPKLVENPTAAIRDRDEASLFGDRDEAAEPSASAEIAPDNEVQQGTSSATGAAEPQAQPAQPAPVFQQEPTPAGEPVAREQLPATASVLPLVFALGGLMALGGAWLKRRA